MDLFLHEVLKATLQGCVCVGGGAGANVCVWCVCVCVSGGGGYKLRAVGGKGLKCLNPPARVQGAVAEGVGLRRAGWSVR